jgi:alkanesulfonate monooxygenase SsuD/methylene tetrahydromethanopterin reductase-like flavin-dependent oxidoreductase (luciferase family)
MRSASTRRRKPSTTVSCEARTVTPDNLLGRLGVWVSRGSLGAGQAAELAAVAEELGYDTFWVSGGAAPGVFDAVQEALLATGRIVVATGVVNIWVDTPRPSRPAGTRPRRRRPGGWWWDSASVTHHLSQRAVLAITHAPLQRIEAYFDALDSVSDPLPPERRLLGARGPEMPRLAARRSLGAHPYLVTPATPARRRRSSARRCSRPSRRPWLTATRRELVRRHVDS